jgi:hypothetical protein
MVVVEDASGLAVVVVVVLVAADLFEVVVAAAADVFGVVVVVVADVFGVVVVVAAVDELEVAAFVVVAFDVVVVETYHH